MKYSFSKLKNTLIKVIFIVLICNLSFTVNAQDSLLINLENALLNAKDTTRIQILDDLCWNYLYVEPKKSYLYGKQALVEVKNFPQSKQLHSNILNDLGTYFLVTSQYDSALYYYDESMKIKVQLNDQRGIVGLKSKKSAIYNYRGQYGLSLKEQEGVVDYFEKTKDSVNLANALNNLGELNYNLGNFKVALKIHLKNLPIRKAVKDTIGLATTYHGIGVVLYDIGDNSGYVAYYDSALFFAQIANRNEIVATLYHNKAVILLGEGKYKEAEKLLLDAIAFNKESNDTRSICSSLNVLADIHTRRKEYEKSLSILRKSLIYGKQINSYDLLRYTYSYMSANYSYLGKADSTFYYAQLASQMKDSLFKEQSVKALHEFEIKYETTKKEAQNLALVQENELQNTQLLNEKEQKRNLYFFFSGTMIFILVIALLMFNRTRLKRKAENEKRQAGEQKIRFKAVIDGEEKERIRIARELHDGLGQILSTAKLNVSGLEGTVHKEDEILLKNAMELIDDAVKEVRNVSHNMMPAALIEYGLVSSVKSLANKISEAKTVQVICKINGFENRLDQSIEISLYRVIQEILNNVIKHANASEISIFLEDKKTEMNLKIEDNGKGFDTSKINASSGIGWKNIYSRVALINGEITIKSEALKGSSIQISIKNDNK
ncbi:MAG: sensor histidine kinase [Bacteroidota bacterium]|nr:sensor histidine kinase [Bacteroidota bacterium]